MLVWTGAIWELMWKLCSWGVYPSWILCRCPWMWSGLAGHALVNISTRMSCCKQWIWLSSLCALFGPRSCSACPPQPSADHEHAAHPFFRFRGRPYCSNLSWSIKIKAIPNVARQSQSVSSPAHHQILKVKHHPKKNHHQKMWNHHSKRHIDLFMLWKVPTPCQTPGEHAPGFPHGPVAPSKGKSVALLYSCDAWKWLFGFVSIWQTVVPGTRAGGWRRRHLWRWVVLRWVGYFRRWPGKARAQMMVCKFHPAAVEHYAHEQDSLQGFFDVFEVFI